VIDKSSIKSWKKRLNLKLMNQLVAGSINTKLCVINSEILFLAYAKIIWRIHYRYVQSRKANSFRRRGDDCQVTKSVNRDYVNWYYKCGLANSASLSICSRFAARTLTGPILGGSPVIDSPVQRPRPFLSQFSRTCAMHAFLRCKAVFNDSSSSVIYAC
jgi:hypothetical protein